MTQEIEAPPLPEPAYTRVGFTATINPQSGSLSRQQSVQIDGIDVYTADQLHARDAYWIERLKEAVTDAERYRWRRAQSNNTDAPRIDVVHWQAADESANQGDGLRMEELDAAIDRARSNPQGGEK